ncbi:MAG: tyrosine-protein phosphatase, partial [Bacteroidales bacterium]|nr:tyrosine-protein phosphatase [Bacteroidales bacterium]
DNCGGSRCRNPLHDAAQGQVGDPARYTLHDESVAALRFIGIDADLDLRGVTGEGLWGNQCMTHTRSLGLSKIPGADYGQIMTDIALHRPFEDPAVVRDVAWIIQELKKGRHVAFHCRSGADRTGAVAMILEALLGVRGGDIALDYELTSLSSEGSGQTRSAKNVLSSGYGFYGRGFTTLEVDEPDPDRRLQKQAYRYLNTAFPEYAISTADLDWFIGFMLE